MTEQYDEFLEEIKQDLQQEKYKALWKKYGKYVVGAFVALLAATGAYTLYNNHVHKQTLQQAELFLGAQELILKNEPDQALAVLESIIKGPHNSYAMLAQFMKAALFEYKSKPEEQAKALETFKSISSDLSYPSHIRDIATLTAVSIQLEGAKDKDIDDLLAKVTPLAAETSPFRFVAQEQKALLTLHKGNQLEAAEMFANLAKSDGAPEGIAMRATLMSQTLSTQIKE